MNTSILRRKRIVLPALATAAVLAVGGTVWAASADSDDLAGEIVRHDDRDADDRDADDRVLAASERSAAARAALAAVGGGTVTEVEASDDRGVAYEVEVRDAAGVEWDVDLAPDLTVVTKHADR